MAERNSDKIKRLQHDLGRYVKKVQDQEKIIKDQGMTIAQFENGNKELNRLVNALLIQMALFHGREVRDFEGEDADGAKLGWQFAIPIFDAGKLTKEYDVKARKDEKLNQYIIGVIKKDGT